MTQTSSFTDKMGLDRRRDPYGLYLLGKNLVEAASPLDLRWNHFKSVMHRRAQDMVVVIPLPEDIIEAVKGYENDLDVSLVSPRVIMERPAFSSKHVRLPTYSALIHVLAEDPRTAAHKAWEILAQNLYALCSFSGLRLNAGPGTSHVEYRGSTGRRVVRVPLNRPTRLSVKEAHELRLLTGVLSNKALTEDDRTRFWTAIEYSYLGLTASSPSIGFTHNWVALESFIRQAGPPMADIRRYMPSLHCWTYVTRVLNNFLEDCSLCNIDLTPVLGEGGDSSVRIRRLVGPVLECL